MGAWKRGLMALVGLGSESSWLCSHSRVPVLVVPPSAHAA